MSSPEAQDFEDADWTERLIQVIQSKPLIYNTSLPAHSDRKLISRFWNEVFVEMIPNWNNLSARQKNEQGKQLQGKWRNLRTCFRRELAKQKTIKSGEPMKKRRKYIYFDQLLFLLPTMEDYQTVSEYSPSQDNYFKTEDESETIKSMEELQPSQNVIDSQMSIEEPVIHPSSQNVDSSQTSVQQSVSKLTRNQSQIKTEKNFTYEDSSLSMLRQSNAAEGPIDEDKYFLLSLIPSLKKLDDIKKFEAKMEFLGTLKRLTEESRQSAGHETYGSSGYQYEDFARNSTDCSGNNFLTNYSATTSAPMPSDDSKSSLQIDPHPPTDAYINLN